MNIETMTIEEVKTALENAVFNMLSLETRLALSARLVELEQASQ